MFTFFQKNALCLFAIVGLASTAVAAKPLTVTLNVANPTASDFLLASADWEVDEVTALRYTIPAGQRASFRFGLGNSQKDEITFSYSSAGKECKYVVGHDRKRSFGWFSPTYTPYQYAEASSVGRFKARCEASVLRNTPGEGYVVKIDMN